MPITLQFGPWSPDLANDPVQIPDTQGPMPIPCADVLNVYFANGSYKSIPSPLPAVVAGVSAQVLPEAAVNAYSYFDYVQQQQTVFVGTVDSIQQLASDGSWTVLQFLTNQTGALLGQSMGFTIGHFANTDKLKGASAKFTAGAFSARITGTSIVAGQVVLGGGGGGGGGGIQP